MRNKVLNYMIEGTFEFISKIDNLLWDLWEIREIWQKVEISITLIETNCRVLDFALYDSWDITSIPTKILNTSGGQK